jgi:NADH dehydrogenase FAD-containing subunit
VDKRVDAVVIGGGYAGVMAANRLTKDDRVRVTMVNPRPVFVERIRLHQRLCGSHDAVAEFRDVLSDRVRLVVDTAQRIDAARRTVVLADGGDLTYDHLVYAVGSRTEPARIPGAAQFALPISSLDEADRLRDAVRRRPDARIVVVGGGSSGMETAAELADVGHRVTLVSRGALAPALHASGRRVVSRGLARLGVTVLDGSDAGVVEATADGVRLADGRMVPGDIIVWTAGFGVPDLARRSGLSTDADGRIRTDETLTSVDDERFVAAGDAMVASHVPLRMSCQAALPLGAAAAETVLARIRGDRPRPVTVGYFAQCVSIGRSAGLFQMARPDDTATRMRMAGRTGARIKESICRQTVSTMAHEARKPGSTRWIGDRSRARRVDQTPVPIAAG